MPDDQVLSNYLKFFIEPNLFDVTLKVTSTYSWRRFWHINLDCWSQRYSPAWFIVGLRELFPVWNCWSVSCLQLHRTCLHQRAPVPDPDGISRISWYSVYLLHVCLLVEETGPKTSVCWCYTATFLPGCSRVSELRFQLKALGSLSNCLWFKREKSPVTCKMSVWKYENRSRCGCLMFVCMLFFLFVCLSVQSERIT